MPFDKELHEIFDADKAAFLPTSVATCATVLERFLAARIKASRWTASASANYSAAAHALETPSAGMSPSARRRLSWHGARIERGEAKGWE